ncbi:MAG: glycosyltransferase [Ktedonobacterales bacterium]|nr:glycosyltransferase [Ktedonobacterales bacterium]
MRVALVHDYLNQMGGAEKVLLALHQMFPSAPVYTTIAALERLPPAFHRMDIRTGFMQRLPGVLDHHQIYLPLYPFAVERMDLRAYDLVLSDSSAFAKAAIKRPGAVHLCYCHTPMRWAWNYAEYIAREELSAPVRAALPPIIARLRRWDAATVGRVDRFIANSAAVAARIRNCYGRTAEVIPPPVEVTRFEVARGHGGYFLILARLVPYKRIDLAVQACSELGVALKVIGAGRDETRLRALAGPSVEFLGALPDAAAHAVLANCRALLFPGEEDFGIAPVEAQACGKPVIAYAAGGALTTIIPGHTGLFFHEPTVAALMAALNLFRDGDFDPLNIRRHAEYFAAPHFARRMMQAISQTGITMEPATLPLPTAA